MVYLIHIYYLNFHFSNFYQLSSQFKPEASGNYEKDGPTSPKSTDNEINELEDVDNNNFDDMKWKIFIVIFIYIIYWILCDFDL